MNDLKNSEDRVNTINSMSSELISQGHSESVTIEKRCTEINQMWTDVKELADARQDALAGAEMVMSMFDMYIWPGYNHCNCPNNFHMKSKIKSTQHIRVVCSVDILY